MLESVDENLITYNCNFPLPDGVALVIDSDDVAVFWRRGDGILTPDTVMVRRIWLVWFPESDRVYF